MGRPRQWTDEQLRAAVAASSTWGEVVTRMWQADYGATRRNFQGHAVRLELPVDHLPSFRPVRARQPCDRRSHDPDQLAAAISASISWAGVLHCLGLPKSGSVQARIRALANELGLDFLHFRGQAWGATPAEAVDTPFTRERDTRLLHKAAAARATAWFMERGYTVCIPVEPALYDLVVDSDAGLVRVQVKSTTSHDRTGRWLVRIHRMAYDPTVKPTANGSRIKCVYAPGEVDFFFVVTADGDNYLIPLESTNGVSSLTLDSKYAAFKVA
jgi:hypothetical protein